jgi:citronellol/citronellal dehydrogenase
MDRLKGKIALVTGASRGIGEAIARRFAAEGATVICCARSADAGASPLPGSLHQLVDTITKDGGKAFALPSDLSNLDERKATIAEVNNRYGDVDILVNNAATTTYGSLLEHVSDSQYEQLFELNLRCPFHLAQGFVPGMKRRGRGWILNITSSTAEMPSPPYSPFECSSGVLLYGTSKAALNRLTCGMAAELAEACIAVNALAPVSVVWTPSQAALGMDRYRSSPAWKEEPIEAMAEAALALCSGDPTKQTGRCVYTLPFLDEINQAIHGLDGQTLISNWAPAIP